MTWKVELTKKAEKEFAILPKVIQKRIIGALELLSEYPNRGKKLKGEFTGYYRYRVYDYRILYTLENEKLVVLILRIKNRKDVYRLPP